MTDQIAPINQAARESGQAARELGQAARELGAHGLRIMPHLQSIPIKSTCLRVISEA